MELDETNVKKLLDYDAETGVLTWKARGPEWDISDKERKRWNTRYSRKQAFTSRGNHGYFQASVFGKKYLAHRIVWMWVFGRWPENQIDHINRDKCDNRIVNLRDVTQQQNLQNQAIQKNNTSGHLGVSWYKKRQKWQVHITVNSKQKYLGTFESIEDAIAARAAADIEYGFHENHGRDADGEA